MADRGEVRADELGAALEMPVSTVYRYLRTLVDFGFDLSQVSPSGMARLPACRSHAASSLFPPGPAALSMMRNLAGVLA